MADEQQPKELHVLMVESKKTANTVMFAEVEQPGGQVVLRTLYVQKKALARIGNPQMIDVVVRPGAM